MPEASMTDLLVILARVEGKVDTLVKASSDHEIRIRIIEQRGVVTTKMFWAGLMGASTSVAAITQFVAFARAK